MDLSDVNIGYRKGIKSNLPGMICISHYFTVPLNWNRTEQGNIEIFVRELIAAGSNTRDQEASSTTTPYLLYLQGGPGFASPRVLTNSGWIKRALKDYRVLLLDQRGTGLSSPILLQSLVSLSPTQQFDFLKLFRADSIVKDAEAIRQTLLGPQRKWTILGQSFGGFCLMTYLSFYPAMIEAGIFTGGIPPIGRSAEEVYTALGRRVAAMNARYYARYPGDVIIVREIVSRLRDRPEPLPSGGLLTARRFLQLGLCLGSGTGSEDLHYLIEEAFITIPPSSSPSSLPGQSNSSSSSNGERREFSYKFLKQVESWQSYDTNPLYALLHEPIYCDGPGTAARWAAERVINLPEMSAIFDIDRILKDDDVHHHHQGETAMPMSPAPAATPGDMPTSPSSLSSSSSPFLKPILFTGEHIFPFMFERGPNSGDDGRGSGGNQEYIYRCLGPLREAAHMLAQYDQWNPLYDIETLRRNRVPCASIIYWADIFVERSFSEETASLIGGNFRCWLTNEYAHSGIRDDGFNILDRLLGMLRGESHQY